MVKPASYLHSTDRRPKEPQDVFSVANMELMLEIFSELNYYATQKCFSVHEPTMVQLVENYVDSGGFQRFLDDHSSLARFLSC